MVVTTEGTAAVTARCVGRWPSNVRGASSASEEDQVNLCVKTPCSAAAQFGSSWFERFCAWQIE